VAGVLRFIERAVRAPYARIVGIALLSLAAVASFTLGWYAPACFAMFGLGCVFAPRSLARTEEHARLEKLQDNFIATVSHELRTPLTSINGSLALLTTGLLERQPERADRMLRIAAANADRLARLVDDVLDVERLASGTAPLALEQCAPSDLVDAAVDAVRVEADRRGVSFVVDAPRELRLMADPRRLRQVLEQILENAVKFSPHGGTVEVKVEAADNDVRVAVKDSGRSTRKMSPVICQSSTSSTTRTGKRSRQAAADGTLGCSSIGRTSRTSLKRTTSSRRSNATSE